MADAFFPYGATTYSYTRRFGARDCLVHLKGLGFSRFDLVIQPGHIWPSDMAADARSEFRSFVDGEGLEITTLNLPNADLNLASTIPEVRATTRKLLSDVIGLAGDIGACRVIVGPGKPNGLFPAPRAQMTEWMFEALGPLADHAEACGTGLLVENMPFAFLPDMASLCEALEVFGDRRIGLIYDVANGTFIGEDVAEGLRRASDHLYMVHCSDTGMKTFRHDAVGSGVVDFAKAAEVLSGLKTSKPPLLEIITPEPDADLVSSATALLARRFSF